MCASSSRSHTHFSPEKEKQEPDLFIKGLGSEEEAGLQECNKSSVHRQSAVLTDKLCVAGEFGMPSTLSDTWSEKETGLERVLNRRNFGPGLSRAITIGRSVVRGG